MPMDEFVCQQGNKEFVLALSVKDLQRKNFNARNERDQGWSIRLPRFKQKPQGKAEIF
ncbi:MAG: hypothetical protein ACUVWV_15975 [Thermodesulfobacteriota bacterium]